MALYTFEGDPKITLEENGQFRVHFPDNSRNYNSKNEADEAVERYLKAQERNTRVKLNLPALVEYENNITECVITGVHATQLRILSKPPAPNSFANYYPLTQEVRDLLTLKKTLKKQIASCQQQLDDRQIRIASRYYGETEEAAHARAIAELQAIAGQTN